MEPNPAGMVRVNNLAHLEALLKTVGHGAEIVGVALGILFLVLTFRIYRESKKKAIINLVVSVLVTVIGLSIPGFFDWLVASPRDESFFS
ncbi:MAG: hypothetical protein K2Y22_08560 [Candidatus Obscuribacterales bacterium]|nr:hypothetical protein [Candidatus Obscuribacterales bacterium]